MASKGQDNGGICCYVKCPFGIKVHNYHMKVVQDTTQSTGVVIVYFLFVLESSFLSLTLSNWVSRSASGS